MSDPVYRFAREVFGLGDSFLLNDSLGAGSIPGWDSLGTMKLALAIEERFGIHLELADIAELNTLADLRSTLSRCDCSGMRE
jgi:acyl carrier protein